MTFVSITRLRLRSLRFLPGFLRYTLAASRQARASGGLLGGYVANGPKLTFWTVSVWRDDAAMRAFRAGGAHLKAMPKLMHWCDEASVAHWRQEIDDAPSIPEAARRLVAEGRLSKVRRPSPGQAEGDLWPDRVLPRLGFRLRAKG